MKRDAIDELMPALSAVEITELDPRRTVEWDAYVTAHPHGTFFHLAGWHSIVENVFDHRAVFLMAKKAGRICGVLPLCHMKTRLFGHSLLSLPFCVYGGVIADDPETTQALLKRAEQLAMRDGAGHVELRQRDVPIAGWDTTDLYVTFRKPISEDPDVNMKAIPRKQRAMVRKGMASGLVVGEDGDCTRFFDLYADNVHRHGTPALPKRYFEALLKTFPGQCGILTATAPNGEAISSVLSFRFRDEILPYYAGDALKARGLAANDYKYWELMRRSTLEGVRIFDYGRSKVGTGPYDFKRNWGFEPQPLPYAYRLAHAQALPNNNPLNPKYQRFIAIWRRLPLAVATAVGPHIVRGLG